MPWQGVSTMELREAFAQSYLRQALTMTELCEQYGISRKTGYKWARRVQGEGLAGLRDRSRRPQHSPTATAPAIVEQLCAARRQHPHWSARKLIAVLRRTAPTVPWPSRSTGCALLKAHGLVRARRRHSRGRAPASALPPATEPNALWTTDFKGEFRTGDGRYCYPLTVRDAFSRYVLRCDALLTRASDGVRAQFERAFREYGLPERIRSDNGGPFAGIGLTRLSRLAVWWIRLGIRPERIALGHPEQNGSHEQFHRVLKAETTRPPAATAAQQQRRFRRFCRAYNEVRPHEALADQPPAHSYTPSPRPWPTRLPPLQYAGHLITRRVSTTGCISWRGRPVHLTEVLAGEDVALDEIDDDLWLLYYATIRLARLEGRTGILTAVAPTP